MKGFVKFELGSEGIEYREVAEPSPKAGELKVKVLAAGICNSDVHAIHDERATVMPVVLGHEYVGQVVETCGEVGDFKAGDWVLTLPACYSCGECDMCKQGVVTLCKQRKSIGSHVNGAMANYVIVPAKYSFRIEGGDKMTKEQLIPYALTEPMACVIRGVYEKIDVKPGDVAVISGPGIMGQFAVQAFKARGAYVILSGLEVDMDKLQMAKQYGADEIVTNPDDLAKAVYAKNPNGADITCDATGVIPSLKTCLGVIRPMGTHLQLGLFGGEKPFRLDAIFDREVSYIPSNSSSMNAWKISLELLAQGKLTLAPYVSMQTPLENWKEAMDAVLAKKVYKAVLLPDNEF
ncbi:MAG: alcohol dehydrogenase catalytic domain-containing protein [Clostridia bacterium]|nr:alcohol dehydrogenase catalytic domain-containing protein [Clostridia bacterium]